MQQFIARRPGRCPGQSWWKTAWTERKPGPSHAGQSPEPQPADGEPKAESRGKDVLEKSDTGTSKIGDQGCSAP